MALHQAKQNHNTLIINDIEFFPNHKSITYITLGYGWGMKIESWVTLKFRSPDRYIAKFENLSAISSKAKTKLEADIGISTTSTFNVVYGHSTTTPNTHTINNMNTINIQFPGFSRNYKLPDNMPLKPVGNLTVREHVYTAGSIDLGSKDGKISITLWYDKVPLGTQKPIVTEVSFKYKDKSADYTKKLYIVQKHHLALYKDWLIG